MTNYLYWNKIESHDESCWVCQSLWPTVQTPSLDRHIDQLSPLRSHGQSSHTVRQFLKSDSWGQEGHTLWNAWEHKNLISVLSNEDSGVAYLSPLNCMFQQLFVKKLTSVYEVYEISDMTKWFYIPPLSLLSVCVDWWLSPRGFVYTVYTGLEVNMQSNLQWF